MVVRGRVSKHQTCPWPTSEMIRKVSDSLQGSSEKKSEFWNGGGAVLRPGSGQAQARLRPGSGQAQPGSARVLGAVGED